VLVRYKPDGSIDTTFGRGGKVAGRGTTDNDTYEGLVILRRGELVAAGATGDAHRALSGGLRGGHAAAPAHRTVA